MTPEHFLSTATAWVTDIAKVVLLAIDRAGVIVLSVLVWRGRVARATLQATQAQHEIRLQGVESGVQTALADAPPPGAKGESP